MRTSRMRNGHGQEPASLPAARPAHLDTLWIHLIEHLTICAGWMPSSCSCRCIIMCCSAHSHTHMWFFYIFTLTQLLYFFARARTQPHKNNAARHARSLALSLHSRRRRESDARVSRPVGRLESRVSRVWCLLARLATHGAGLTGTAPRQYKRRTCELASSTKNNVAHL